MFIQSVSYLTFLDRLGLRKRPKYTTTLPAGMVYGVDDRPPLPLTLLAGLQCVGLINISLVHLLVLMHEGRVPPATMTAMVGLSMLALGVAALLQALPRGPVGSGYFCPAVPQRQLSRPIPVGDQAGRVAPGVRHDGIRWPV